MWSLSLIHIYECTNGDSLVQCAVQPDKSDTAAIGSTAVRFVFADQLHGFYFRSATQGSGRESKMCIRDSYAASTRPPTYFTSISEASVFSVPLPKPIVK